MMHDMVSLHLNGKAYRHYRYFTIWFTKSHGSVPSIRRMLKKLHHMVSGSREQSQRYINRPLCIRPTVSPGVLWQCTISIQ